jgi:hypothetical protein
MEKQNRENSGNDHYELLFAHALRQVFLGMQQKHDSVCMKCRRFLRTGDIPSECCKTLAFPVDPKSVIIDSETGLVTQAAPAVKTETSKDA